MAQQIITSLVDDLDGTEASENITFSIDGTTYEIDLSDKNAAKMRRMFSAYTGAARKTGGRTARGKASKTTHNSGGGDTQKIRAWAKGKGYEVNDRGRISSTIREAYAAANS